MKIFTSFDKIPNYKKVREKGGVFSNKVTTKSKVSLLTVSSCVAAQVNISLKLVEEFGVTR